VATDQWDTTFTLDASADVVYRHLADPYSYVGLSPLVVAVRDVRQVTDSRGRVAVAYVAVERFQFARVLHWDNHIKVVMTSTKPGRELVSDVVSPGWVRLTSRVTLTPLDHGIVDSGTQVTESVDVTFPAPLRRFVTGQARAVAAYRAEELIRRMSRPMV
jgi:hypothetical protein